ncbi:MAG: hypothetical protein H0U74_15750 [Bradymonadaceae bacterium]|nr:hypothetical protein [Lujinxingiaceae bacterium]
MKALKALGALAAVVVYFFAVLGFGGLTSDSVAMLEQARQVASTLSGGGWAALLASPHAGAELVAGLVSYAFAASDTFWLWILSAMAIVASVPAVYRIGARFHGQSAAVVASVVFATSAPIVAAATSISTSALCVFAWCWLLDLTTAQPRWYKMLIAAALSAFLLLSWAPVFLWMVLWLVVTVSLSGRAELAPLALQERGMMRPAAIDIGVVLVPAIALLLASVVHPGMWSGLIAGWQAVLGSVIEARPAALLFRGEMYPPARPPIDTGLTFILTRFSLVAVAAALLGLVFAALSQHLGQRPPKKLYSGLALAVVLLALLPWMLRSTHYGRVDTLAMVAPIIAIFAGYGVARLIELARAMLGILPGQRADIAIKAAVALLAITPLCVESALAHPHHGSYYNGLVGGLAGAADHGYPLDHDGLVPAKLLNALNTHAGSQPIWAGELAPYLRELATMRNERPLNYASTIGDGQVFVRRYQDFSPRDPTSASRATASGGEFDTLQLGPAGVFLFAIDRPFDEDGQ